MKMKKHKIVWLLLLAAFIVPMGFNEIAFAASFDGTSRHAAFAAPRNDENVSGTLIIVLP